MSAFAFSGNFPPFVELDAIPFPVVEGSQLQRSPLNPFSPAIQAGNSARVTDARLAVQVWDNFTGGLGQRDEQGAESTSHSEGNMDTRVPGAVALPPLPTLLVATGFNHSADAHIFVEYMRHATTPGIFMWSRRSTAAKLWRNNTLTSRPLEYVRGFVSFKGAYWYISYHTTDGSKLYRTTDAGATWTVTKAWAGTSMSALVNYDNRLVSYNNNTGNFEQSLDGTTWTVHSTGPELRPLELISELFVWTAPGGARDAVFALTTQRIVGYEDEALTWHTFYDYEGIFRTDYPTQYMWRRDSNIYMAPFDENHGKTTYDQHGMVMMFTPGVADEVGPTKRFGLPTSYVDGIFRLQGGIHWLFAFAHGAPGGLFALNEFGGWSQLFDPRVVTGSTTAHLIGGGYSNGVGYAITDNGNLYSIDLKDRREMHPRSDGTTYATGEHYHRSSWTTHNQTNRWKIGAYFEIDCRRGDGTSGIPAGSVAKFRYRVDNGEWVTIDVGGAPENDYGFLLALPTVKENTKQWPVRIPLPQGLEQTGVAYRRLQWEWVAQRSNPATDTPVLASVALYYTFWSGNYYAYQFNIDLSKERFELYPDGMYGDYSRQELMEILLGFNEGKRYHTFTYGSGPTEEHLPAVDILVASREDMDMGGGIYSVTVRDLRSD